MADFAYPSIYLDAGGLCLETTLFCGQCFSWQKMAGGFAGAAGRHGARLCQEGDTLLVTPLNAQPDPEDFWRRYLDLDTDYAALQARLRQNPKLAPCVEYAGGIRLLRQPFWDTLLTFIISQNNHLPRIFGIVERLRVLFGERLAEGVYALPKPEVLAALEPEDLAELRAGFRAKYLIDAARRVAGGSVTEQKMAALPDNEARALLQTIRGVGPKVADCVLLFGLGRRAVAPMDVWMKRACNHLFGEESLPPETGGFGGIAQQYVFWWARDNLGR